MQQQTLELAGASPGQRLGLQLLRFGREGARPKATITAALHADEVPALLVAQVLRRRLLQLEAEGAVLGEVLLLPFANPIGLAQQVLGKHVGRFDLRDGINFNREFADLGQAAVAAVQGRLGTDAAANVALARQALAAAADGLTAHNPAADLKKHLLRLAIDADIVLDLHSDAEAVVHLYALTPQAELATDLGARLGARAILLATDCGDSPLDEVCTRPWLTLQQACPAQPLPLACFATTVELRGQADTDHALAERDAEALLQFLQRQGVLAGTPPAAPPPACAPTPLAATEPIVAPVAGVLVFRAEVGALLRAGEPVADLVNPETGALTTLRAESEGLLFARVASRWAMPGRAVAKLAGRTRLRSGKLLGS